MKTAWWAGALSLSAACGALTWGYFELRPFAIASSRLSQERPANFDAARKEPDTTIDLRNASAADATEFTPLSRHTNYLGNKKLAESFLEMAMSCGATDTATIGEFLDLKSDQERSIGIIDNYIVRATILDGKNVVILSQLRTDFSGRKLSYLPLIATYLYDMEFGVARFVRSQPAETIEGDPLNFMLQHPIPICNNVLQAHYARMPHELPQAGPATAASRAANVSTPDSDGRIDDLLPTENDGTPSTPAAPQP